MSPPQRYSFVNARPETKAEKRKTRTAIRSHIGRWTQEKQQKLDASNTTSSESEKNSPPESSRTVSASPAPSELPRPRPRDKLVAARRSDSLGGVSGDKTSGHDSNTEDESDIHSSLSLLASAHLQENPLFASSRRSAIQVLGSTVLDPFQTYASTFPPSLVSQCHEYSLKVLWPGLTPRPVDGEDPPASKAWFPIALSDTVALHSLLFGALSHKRLNMLTGAGQSFDLDITGLEEDMRRCEIESIGLINKALRRADRAIDDAMIVSVLCLAANAWDMTLEKFLNEPAPAPIFDPLLRSLQWLDIYGLLSAHPIHAAGLVQLINLRGGLHNLETPGLAATIFYFGILSATKNLTAPLFPFVPLVEGNVHAWTLEEFLGTYPTELRNEFIFGGLFELGLTNDLAQVLIAMQRYERSVEIFVDGALPDLDFARFCDHRNLIQHAITSIPSQDDTPLGERAGPVFEPMRLALLLYSVTVIFPLPPQTAPVAALTGRLKAALRDTDLRSNWSSSHQARRLLIWILVVGGAAARDQPDERSWFVGVLRRLTAKENAVRRFEDLKRDVLNRILWLGRSCDTAGRLLWAEILGVDEQQA